MHWNLIIISDFQKFYHSLKETIQDNNKECATINVYFLDSIKIHEWPHDIMNSITSIISIFVQKFLTDEGLIEINPFCIDLVDDFIEFQII